MARNALMDFAQSASNAVASNVSGPVDLISMGLRKIGVPVPTNALMSSEWMAQRGLTRDVPMGAARIAGETLGMAGPTVVAAKAPQVAAALNQGAANIAAARTIAGPSSRQRGMIAWHGSPHEFDAFDRSKFGRGGFENLHSGSNGFEPAAYASTSPEHARKYGEHLFKVDVNTRGALTEKIAPELNEWARQNGYKNAQAMIDGYYDGSPYLAADLDKRIDDLVKRSPAGVAVIDFGNLLLDRRIPMGKVIATKDFNALRILERSGQMVR